VNEVGQRDRVLAACAHLRHLANTVDRLYEWRVSGSAARVATRPVPKLLWAILLFFINATLIN